MTFWEAAVGETVVCVIVIFMTEHAETPLLLRKMEKSLRAICHESITRPWFFSEDSLMEPFAAL